MFIVFFVIHSPLHKPHSELYLPIFSPSNVVLFHPSQVKEQTEDILDLLVSSKASLHVHFRVFILSTIIVFNSSPIKS